MNDHNDHSDQYSAEDIQRYLKGEMSAEEMHALETAALEDPFLADAIEGFEAMIGRKNEDAAELELMRLKRNFNERVREPAKVVPMSHSRWWQISAAAVVVIIVGFALYNNREKEEAASQLAATEKKQADTLASSQAAAAAQSRSPLPGTSDTKDTNSSIALHAPVAASKKTASPGDHSANNKFEKAPRQDRALAEKAGKRTEEIEKLEPQSQAKEISVVDRPAIAKNAPAKTGIEEESPGALEAVSKRNNQLALRLNNFSGRVVDTNNRPLPNASLQILQNRTNVLTDETGNFNFSTKDSIVDVQVGLIGFEPRNFRLHNDAITNNIVLQPTNRDLNEVVVTGYGAERKKAVSRKAAKVQDAVPEIGWIEYEKYLEKNKRIPAGEYRRKGEVKVSFDVNQTGVVSDFKIEKSLANDYDKEAIRLVQEGPSWKLLTGQRTRVTVTVKF